MNQSAIDQLASELRYIFEANIPHDRLLQFGVLVIEPIFDDWYIRAMVATSPAIVDIPKSVWDTYPPTTIIKNVIQFLDAYTFAHENHPYLNLGESPKFLSSTQVKELFDERNYRMMSSVISHTSSHKSLPHLR